MSKAILSRLPIAVAFLLPVFAIAQTPTGNRTPELQTTDGQITDWRITEKEVKAVQAELTRHGYYKSKITGVLDRDTREAVRAYQADNGLKDTGRIDLPTYGKLGLTYPATGKEADSLRRNGLLPKIGYEVKDTAASAGSAVTGGARKVGSGVRTGLEKTWDAGAATISKSKEVVQDSTVNGAKSAGRSAVRAGDRLIGRSDAEVHAEVRRALEEDPETQLWYTEVKNGTVTIKTPRQHNADIGAVISNIRKVPGVKSVFVIAL
ncbi:MAG: peptidoglycan-binding domain-containing protein [Blastocatellales bacterium]